MPLPLPLLPSSSSSHQICWLRITYLEPDYALTYAEMRLMVTRILWNLHLDHSEESGRVAISEP